MHGGPPDQHDPSPYAGVTPPPSTQPHPGWLAAPPAGQAPPRRSSKIVPRLLGLLVVALGVGLAVFLMRQEMSDSPSAEPSPSSAPATSASASDAEPGPVATTSCDYLPSGDGAVVDVGLPPAEVPAEGTVTLGMGTNFGPMRLVLDREVAPCAAASFVHLTEQGFFDGTPCHRLVTSDGLGVLQCGDPSGTGTGGPAYRYAEEVSPTTTYPRGTIAMAKAAAPGSTGSQFFLCFSDAVLPPEYTVVGSIEDADLAVLDAIAAVGSDGSNGPDDGRPNEPVEITGMTVEG